MLEAFLGAIVGAVSVTTAQWFLGPRIERRVRAQERWEQFIIEFASLIDGPVKRAQDEARSLWLVWQRVHELAPERGNTEPEQLDKLTRPRRDSFRSAASAWSDSLVRAEWLAKRVLGDERTADRDLTWFYTRWMLYRIGATGWDTLTDPPADDPQKWDRADKYYGDLVEAVESLSSRIGMPLGRVHLFRARRRRARAARQAAERKAVAAAEQG